MVLPHGNAPKRDKEPNVGRVRSRDMGAHAPAKDAKIGKPRTLPLRAEWREIIERRIKARTIEGQDGKSIVAEYIFHRGGRRMGEFRKAWRTACAKAGLRAGRKVEGGKTPYDRRRTAVRNMVRGGTRENVAMAISGHRTRAVFDRYDIVDERDLADAVEKTSVYVEKTSVYVASLPTASNVVPRRAVAAGSAR